MVAKTGATESVVIHATLAEALAAVMAELPAIDLGYRLVVADES